MRPDFAYAELEGGGIDIVDEMPVESGQRLWRGLCWGNEMAKPPPPTPHPTPVVHHKDCARR